MGNIFGGYMLYYISWDWVLAIGMLVVIFFNIVSGVIFLYTVCSFLSSELVIFTCCFVSFYIFVQYYVFFTLNWKNMHILALLHETCLWLHSDHGQHS